MPCSKNRETDVEEIVKILSKFELGKLSQDWVETFWRGEFVDIEDLPLEYQDYLQNVNIKYVMNNAAVSIKAWLSSEQPELLQVASTPRDQNRSSTRLAEDGSACLLWETLIEKDVRHKALLPVLCCFIVKGQNLACTESERQLCLNATSLYFMLLAIPGSSVFNIFHPVLFSKALGTLRFASKLDLGKNKDSSTRHSQNSGDAEIEFDSDDDSDMLNLSAQERNDLLKGLNVILHNITMTVRTFSLRANPESVEQLVLHLIDVIRLETIVPDLKSILRQSRGFNCASVTSLVYNAYTILQDMCSKMHGSIHNTATLIMKYLLPTVIMSIKSSYRMPFKELNVLREHTVSFIMHLIEIKKEDTYEAAHVFVQNICMNVPDKADYRQKCSQSVVIIMSKLPSAPYARLLKWLLRFAHAEKPSHRLFALEVIPKLLYEQKRTADEGDEPNQFGIENEGVRPPVMKQGNAMLHKFLLSVVFSRCRDASGTVRAKALTVLIDCTSTLNPSIRKIMEELFLTCSENATDFLSYEALEVTLNDNENRHFNPLPSASVIINELRARALDEKVHVRKSALQVLENLMGYGEAWIREDMLKILSEHCRDPALMVRKQMVVSLTDLLLKYPEHEELQKTWLNGLLPQILDAEVKVQEKVYEGAQRVILDNLVPYERSRTPLTKLPWKLCHHMVAMELHKFFSKMCLMWSKAGALQFGVFRVLKTHVGTENNLAAWIFMLIFSEHVRPPVKARPVPEDKDPSHLHTLFLLEHFHAVVDPSSTIDPDTAHLILKVTFAFIEEFPREIRLTVKNELLNSLRNFSLPVELMSIAIDCVTVISEMDFCTEEESDEDKDTWCGEIIEVCEEYLLSSTQNCSNVTIMKEEDNFFRRLYALGDAAQVCSHRVGGRTFVVLQNLLFQATSETDAVEGELPIPASSTQAIRCSFLPSSKMQAMTVVTLGKLCLQNGDVAKRIVPGLAKLLDKSVAPPVKINILCAFCDLCRRYTAIVDPFVPQMAICLKDRNESVRKEALVLLVQLLQEDYVKMRGAFFFHILQSLCDDKKSIQDMAMFYLTERLLKKQNNIMYQHFVESLFYFNGYMDHRTYNRFKLSPREKQVFSLEGSDKQKERMYLYRFMLEHMKDEQRFQTTYNLCKDVLGGVDDSSVTLSGPGQPLLKDALAVLSSEEIRLSSLRTRTEEEPVDQDGMAAVLLSTAKRTIISEVVKKNVIEIIVPIIIKLKHRLEEMKSPLIRDLMTYLRDLMKDYKNELNNILAADKQLADEIMYDIKQCEAEERARKRKHKKRKGGSVGERAEEDEEEDKEETEGQQEEESDPGNNPVAELLTVSEAIAKATPNMKKNVHPVIAQVCSVLSSEKVRRSLAATLNRSTRDKSLAEGGPCTSSSGGEAQRATRDSDTQEAVASTSKAGAIEEQTVIASKSMDSDRLRSEDLDRSDGQDSARNSRSRSSSKTKDDSENSRSGGKSTTRTRLKGRRRKSTESSSSMQVDLEESFSSSGLQDPMPDNSSRRTRQQQGSPSKDESISECGNRSQDVEISCSHDFVKPQPKKTDVQLRMNSTTNQSMMERVTFCESVELSAITEISESVASEESQSMQNISAALNISHNPRKSDEVFDELAKSVRPCKVLIPRMKTRTKASKPGLFTSFDDNTTIAERSSGCISPTSSLHSVSSTDSSCPQKRSARFQKKQQVSDYDSDTSKASEASSTTKRKSAERRSNRKRTK